MSYRKLHIDGKVWQYVVGNKGCKIKAPNNKTAWVKKHVLLEMTEEAYRDRMYADEDDYDQGIAISPFRVKNYIEHNLMGEYEP